MTSHLLQKRGFTIIELMVVITIIAVLVAITLPSLAAAREVAISTKCLANQRAIAQMVAYYANDNRDYVPTSAGPDSPEVPAKPSRWYWYLCYYYLGVQELSSDASVQDAGATYRTDFRLGNGAGPERVFVCPKAPELGRTGLNHRWQIGYGWNFMALTHFDGANLTNNGQTARMSQIQVPAQTILTGDSDAGWAQAYVITSGVPNGVYPPIYRHMEKCNFSFVDGHATPLGPEHVNNSPSLWTLKKY